MITGIDDGRSVRTRKDVWCRHRTKHLKNGRLSAENYLLLVTQHAWHAKQTSSNRIKHMEWCFSHTSKHHHRHNFYSCLSYLCTKDMELLTSSHSAISNSWFFQTSFKDLFVSVGLSRSLAPIPNAPWFSSETLALYKSLTYLLTYYNSNNNNSKQQQQQQQQQRDSTGYSALPLPPRLKQRVCSHGLEDTDTHTHTIPSLLAKRCGENNNNNNN